MEDFKIKFKEFERKIEKLKRLEKELDSMDTEGLESEVKAIKSILKSPDKIPVIEKGIEKLKVKIERRGVGPVEIEVVSTEKTVPESQVIPAEKVIAELASSPRNAYGVVIGIGKYKDPDIPFLRYAVNDAREIYNILTDPQYGNFPRENVKLLLDEQATLTAIKSAMGTYLARKAGKDDTVCIYFAGHGSPEIDPTGKADDRLEKFIVPYDAKKDDLFSYGLSMDEIRNIYERIESKRVVFFIDSCYSGEAGGRKFSRPDIGARNITISDKFLEDLSGEGRIIITASKPDELSLETTELEHGIFTYYLAEGLKGKADLNKDGVVTANELYSYVYEQVTKKARLLGASQHPLKKGTIMGEIQLTRYETKEMRRIKNLHSISAELVKECKYEEALKKYEEILEIDKEDSEASNCIEKLRKKIGEEIITRNLKCLSDLYYEGKLSPAEYELTRRLLKSRSEDLSKENKKVLKLVNDLLSDQISISTFREEIESRA